MPRCRPQRTWRCLQGPPGMLQLSTRRGKQFNSIVYEERDSYRAGAGRDAVFLNPGHEPLDRDIGDEHRNLTTGLGNGKRCGTEAPAKHERGLTPPPVWRLDS